MLRLLVVEDNQDKLRHILSGLSTIDGCALENIDKARDAQEAKLLLRANTYDLMILDIALPESSDKDPTPNGGIELFEEILERDIYFTPREVVGLTAFADYKAQASHCLDAELWTTLEYNPADESWLIPLSRKIKHIIKSKNTQQSDQSYETDICILTALKRPELSAILNLPWNWVEHNISQDPTTYYKCQLTIDGRDIKIIAASAPRMGMPASAALSMKMITMFKPRFIIMAGIAAGIRGKVQLGDVIAADPSWDYGNGKRSLKDKVPIFSAAPHQIGLDAFVRKKLQQVSDNHIALNDIKRSWPTKCSAELTVHVGPLASGAAVLEDPLLTERIQDQHRKVLGVEMEAYGVFAAAQDAPAPQPKVVVLKSVCDFADEDKNDDYQDYASYTSASLVKLLVESYLFTS